MIMYFILRYTFIFSYYFLLFRLVLFTKSSETESDWVTESERESDIATGEKQKGSLINGYTPFYGSISVKKFLFPHSYLMMFSTSPQLYTSPVRACRFYCSLCSYCYLFCSLNNVSIVL